MDASNLSVIQLAALRAFDSLPLPHDIRVLDAPCGRGELTARLRQAGYDAHGVDIGEAAADVLGEAYHRADLNRRLPFADDAFDLVDRPHRE